MEIINNSKVKTKSFLTIGIGETFNLVQGSNLYLKIKSSNGFNAVNLNTNTLLSMESLDDVILVKAEIHLK